MPNHPPPPPQPPCEFCNGTGETSTFKGVSRFLLSREECPVCCGTGLAPSGREEDGQEPAQKDTTD